MKVVFTNEHISSNDLIINDINICDILVDDGEADQILVDDFLSSYSYDECGNVLNKILSKLSIGGTIIIKYVDIEHMLSTFVTLVNFDAKSFNDVLFYKPVKSMITTEIVKDLLSNFGVTIKTIHHTNEHILTTVVGVRNE